jgi:translation initiation factor IF-1
MTNQIFEAIGVILENLPNTTFRVKVFEAKQPEAIDSVVLCTISGRMKMNWVRLLPGDKVSIEISTLDPTKGRVIYRLK